MIIPINDIFQGNIPTNKWLRKYWRYNTEIDLHFFNNTTKARDKGHLMIYKTDNPFRD